MELAQISDKAIFHKILYFSEFISLFVKVLSSKISKPHANHIY